MYEREVTPLRSGRVSSRVSHLNAEGFGQQWAQEEGSRSLFLCQIETFSLEQGRIQSSESGPSLP